MQGLVTLSWVDGDDDGDWDGNASMWGVWLDILVKISWVDGDDDGDGNASMWGVWVGCDN